MILTNEEKKRIVQSLSWMIEDMKHCFDRNLHSRPGNYSPELKEAMGLLQDVESVMTIETTGYHRRSVPVNCREFTCIYNKKGICTAPKITLESKCLTIIGQLKCVQAEKQELEEEMKGD